MAVRVRIRGRRGAVTVPALVNSGFEAEEPEMILPPELADELGLTTSGIAHYRVAGAVARRAPGFRIPSRWNCWSREGGVRIRALATVLPGESEVIISDRLVSELGIVILDPTGGYGV